MKKALFLSLLVALAFAGHAQSLTTTLTSALPDSLNHWKGFRLTGPATVTSYSKASGFSAMTGIGLAYTWQHLSSDSTNWTVDEAVGIMAYAGGSSAPQSLNAVLAVGPYVSFFNGYLSIGGAWNFTTQKPMLTLGCVLPLISN